MEITESRLQGLKPLPGTGPLYCYERTDRLLFVVWCVLLHIDIYEREQYPLESLKQVTILIGIAEQPPAAPYQHVLAPLPSAIYISLLGVLLLVLRGSLFNVLNTIGTSNQSRHKYLRCVRGLPVVSLLW